MSTISPEHVNRIADGIDETGETTESEMTGRAQPITPMTELQMGIGSSL